MDSLQRAFDNMVEKRLDEMTPQELVNLQWLVMQALKEKLK